MNEMLEEKAKFEIITKEYTNYLKDISEEYTNIYNLIKDEEERERRKAFLENRIRVFKDNLNKPYFARIDFLNNDSIKDICYIGKVGLINYDNKIIIVDWRSPIASLYYDANIGICSYQVEDKIVTGNLLLKRQYDIINGSLVSFYDVDTVSNDELLKPYLGVSADARLKNIVSTIQSEQNEIIRSSPFKNLIIQGVAGSGKTTVALHRIAYLAYNYKNLIKNNQYMVIGPNKFFINYISKILPDLDVNDVKQYDLIEFTYKYLNEDIVINDSYSSKYKCSMDFKNKIDIYFNNYFDLIVKDLKIKIKDFILISNNTILNIYSEVKERHYDSLNQIIDRLLLLLDKHLIDNYNQIIDRINTYYDNKLDSGLRLEVVRNERTNTLNEFNKNRSNLVRKYFIKYFRKTSTIYREITNDKSFYKDDIPGLLYVNYKINNSKNFKEIKHVVIDEAQDYNEFTFYTLKKILCSSTFSIYGDVAQSLNDSGLTNWNSVAYLFDDNFKYLNKSYRASIEIMTEANKINRYLNLKEATAVIRHSDEVLYIKTSDIKGSLNKLIDKGLQTIAIITKNEEDVYRIYNDLNKDFNINLITKDKNEYLGGICVLTSYLSKGLEFDGVIVNVDNFDVDVELDMKLLYVSMTRALHNLIVLYDNVLPKPLDNML